MDVTAKKPDPMIYNLARERLGLEASQCVVIEDSMVGLRAAKSASMKCVITYTDQTSYEDFYSEGADAKKRSGKELHERGPRKRSGKELHKVDMASPAEALF